MAQVQKLRRFHRRSGIVQEAEGKPASTKFSVYSYLIDDDYFQRKCSSTAASAFRFSYIRVGRRPTKARYLYVSAIILSGEARAYPMSSLSRE
jgi:hypothetical protein